ncbi:MAG: hypothetical protein EPO02_12910 [Nitrospirae bacterium]|nr:MAG: hypothetical protein EPO02_12910 [Nitrospirota bacterium]
MATFLVALQIASILAVLGRLAAFRIGLPAFAAFLVIDVIEIGIAMWASSATSMNEAVKVWAGCQFALCCGYVAIADELRRRVLRRYPGIGHIASVFVLVAIAIGGMIVMLTAVDPSKGLLRLAVFLPRIMVSILFVAIGCLWLLVRHYPTDLTMNDRIHGKVLSVYLGGRSLTLLAINVGGDPQTSALFGMVISTCCFISWSLLLTGEEPDLVPSPDSSAVLDAAQQRSQRAIEELRGIWR